MPALNAATGLNQKSSYNSSYCFGEEQTTASNNLNCDNNNKLAPAFFGPPTLRDTANDDSDCCYGCCRCSRRYSRSDSDVINGSNNNINKPLLPDHHHHQCNRAQKYCKHTSKHYKSFATTTGQQQQQRNKSSSACCGFRFQIAILVLSAVAMSSYANYTMYIAAIEMISNDVLASGLTELRTKHMAQDPLAIGQDSATPGTCPIDTLNLNAITKLRQLAGKISSPPSALTAAFNKTVAKQQSDSTKNNNFNLTEISLLEQLELAKDTSLLYANVQEKLNNGQLVDWSINQRGLIFTAHTLGGVLFALPIGRLSLITGPKIMLGVCVFIASARMLLLPIMAGQAPLWLFFLFELVLGAPGASISILAYPLAASWLLPDEANFFVALGQFATLIGNAATNFVSTQLLAQKIAWSWCYYLPGIGLALIGFLWTILGADKPEQSRFVSQAELEQLQDSLLNKNQARLQQQQQAESNTNPDLPPRTTSSELTCICCCSQTQTDCPAKKMKRIPNWSTIFTCPTVWALIVVNFAFHWNAKIATLWPTYFANNLHLDAPTIGVLTGLKGVCALVVGSSFVFATRKLAIELPCQMSLTAYRRLNQVFATLTLGVSVALMVIWDCNIWTNFASVMLTPIVSSFNAISYEQMPLDLSAQEDSGLLVSIIRMLAIGDLPALPASSYILSFAPDGLAGNRSTWRLVWLLGLGIKILACLLFVLVAKSKQKTYSRLEPSGLCKTIRRLQQS